MQASRIDRHANSDLVSRRIYFALLIHRTPRRSRGRRRLKMFKSPGDDSSREQMNVATAI